MIYGIRKLNITYYVTSLAHWSQFKDKEEKIRVCACMYIDIYMVLEFES